MLKRKFKEKFDFRGFVGFIRDVFNNHGLGEIRFYPKNSKDIFTDFQLEHISLSWSVDDPRGFAFVWRKYEDKVRTVTFDQFSKFESADRRIRMTIDLDKKCISLDGAKGVPPKEIDKLLENNFGPNLVDHDSQRSNISENQKSKVSFWSKWWWFFIVPLLVGIILLIISKGELPETFKNSIDLPFVSEAVEGTTILNESIFSIIHKHEQQAYSSMLDKQTAFKRYSGMQTQVEVALIVYIEENINEAGVSVLLRSVDQYDENSKSVWCSFSKQWTQKLSTIDQEIFIKFNGVVKNYNNGIVIIENCNLE